MEISSLSDSELLIRTKAAVKNEEKSTQNVLEYLRAVESRRLYAKRGYSSLHDFCIKELGYEGSSAQRRISAMRLIRDIPEAKAKLQSNEVNLSTLNQLQCFIRKEETAKSTKLNTEQKLELLTLIENKSQKECQREFVKISPEVAKQRESLRPVTEELTELKLTASKELIKKLARKIK